MSELKICAPVSIMKMTDAKKRADINFIKHQLSETISKNIDELNKIDAGNWIHEYNVIGAFERNKKPVYRIDLSDINKKLTAAASEILKATVMIDNELSE